MRKIIIAIIVTILAVWNLQGQVGQWIQHDALGGSAATRTKAFMNSNTSDLELSLGGSAKVALQSVWRFNPFFSFSQNLVRSDGGIEIRHIGEMNHEGAPFHRPDHGWRPMLDHHFSNMSDGFSRHRILTLGTDFRILDNTFIQKTTFLRYIGYKPIKT